MVHTILSGRLNWRRAPTRHVLTAITTAALAAGFTVAGTPASAAAAGLATAATAAPAERAPARHQAAPRVPAAPGGHRAAAQSASAQDWPTYLHDSGRSSSTTEPILSTANVPYLQLQWTHLTGGIVAASPAVVGGVVYVGSWDGNQYALDGQTGAVIWSTPLGTTSDPICVPPNLGITSSPSVVNGVVYVGGGDSYWYALDASTGAVLWRVFTGLNTQAGAHYNWSSPLIVGNFAYIGIASVCDAPLIQGQLLKVDLTTHQVVAATSFVPDGEVGGGVWTSPTYDPSTNTVFVSTGTLNLYSQQLSQAVVAIDAGSMTVTDHWQLPFESAVSDSDWGTTPTLTADSQGRQLLSLANKNGVLYTFARNDLAAGPIWQRAIAIGGDCPTCGDGTIASGAFANGVLFYAGGANVDANGIGHGGSVTAFDPGTGAVLWYHATQQPVIGSLVYDNGVIFDPQGQYMEAIDAATGHAIWDYALVAGTYAAPAISNGIVYIGGVDSEVHAFGLPATLPPPPPPDPNCPAGFTCQDIGNPGVAGSEQANGGGSFTVSASGNGRPQGDQMRIITEPATGDFQVGVQDLTEDVGNLTGRAQPQLGIVIRQSNVVGAPFYTALQDPTYPAELETVANVAIHSRQFWGARETELTKSYPQAFPRYLIVQRHGDTFQTLVSADGVHYSLISGSVRTVVMPATVIAGMGVASGTPTASVNATYTKFAIGPPNTTYVEQTGAHACPAAWRCTDVGAGSPIGDQTLAGGAWTLQSGGTGIANTNDSIHFVYQTMAGDGTVTARLTSLSLGIVSPLAQATVLMRADATMASTYYGIVINPAGTATVQWRKYNGIRTRTTIALPTQTMPTWLRIARYTDTARSPTLTYYSALTSTDGATWTQVPGSTVALDLGANPLAGIGGSSSQGRVANPSTWDNVAIAASHVAPPGICPSTFSCTDIGQGYAAGSQMYNTGSWNFQAGGPDIWDVYDTFRFAYQPLVADGTFSARVVSVGPANPLSDIGWEKAGVMLRATTDPQSPYYAVLVTPQNGIAVQWRAAQAGPTTQVLAPGASPAYPEYVMVGRWTDPHTGGATYYTAYTSTDNVTFTAVPGTTVALTMPGTLLAGLAADSRDQKVTLPVSFDNAALFNTEPVPPGACPANFAGCADIGGAAPPGAQTYDATNNVLSMTVGGGDIWVGADQLHMVWDNLAADGVVSARVTSQQNTGPWAKAGVLLRATTDAGSPYYGFFVTPSNGLAVQYRTTQGANTAQLLLPGTVPAYLEVARYTDGGGTTYYTAYTSPNGVTWTPVPGSTVSFSMPGTLLAGWGADSYSQTTSAQVTMANLVVNTSAPVPPGLCPVGWSCNDIGGATPAGGQNVVKGTWTVQGGGGDIWGVSDQFRFISQPASADGTISVRVTAQQATDPFAKAGVMMRGTNDPASPYYALFATPAQGVAVQWRATEGGTTNQLLIAGTVPTYLRVARWTDTTGAVPVTYYSALTSANGKAWTTVPGSAVALALPSSFLEGVAVTSHNTTQLSTVTLVHVALAAKSTEPPGVCSAKFSCSDIGGATPAGTQTQAGTSWTVQAGGGDIFDVSDQFRFISQQLPGNGSATAHVTSLTPTNPWSKAGVMMRADSSAGAAYYAVFVTPSNGIDVQYRPTAGATTSQILVAGTTAPLYLRVTRTGATTYTAFTSSDGVTWTAVPGATESLPGLTGTLLAGLAVTSHDTSQLATATFTAVKL